MSILHAANSQLLHFFQEAWKAIKANGDIIKTISAILAIILFGAKPVRWLIASIKGSFERRALGQRLGSGSYTKEEIFRATSYYVIPDCQNVDPSGGEDWRLTFPVRQNAFSAIDFLLSARSAQKYSLILADSGMGKTSLLLNYFSRHWNSRKRRSKFNLALIPLGQPNVEKQMQSVSDKENTVLFLDALDEDTKAIDNHRLRLTDLLRAASDFRHVLITCRTQFFPRDEEIPAETGLLRVGPIAAGESKEHCFYKMYLSPFSDGQVDTFIKKRFRFWHLKDRSKARRIATRIRDLTVRPMILAHVPDLLESEANFTHSFQIYEEMVSAWLRREHPLVKDTVTLRAFSEYLAIDILKERQRRGAEKISSAELDQLLSKFLMNDSETTELVKHSLERWQLRSRSLLNRDAAGNWKFAHRSIMEYSAAISIFDKQIEIPTLLLTDQIKIFLEELFMHRKSSGAQAARSKLVPLHRVRDKPLSFTSIDSITRDHKQTLAASGTDTWPVSCDVDHFEFFYPELSRIGRLRASRSVTRAEFSGATATVHLPKRYELYAPHNRETAPRIVLTDFVAGLRWHFLHVVTVAATNLLMKNNSDYFRAPTSLEALFLEPILSTRPDILGPALNLTEDYLLIYTSDKLVRDGEEQIFIRYKFEQLRLVSRQILHLQTPFQLEGRGELLAVVEKSPCITTVVPLDDSERFLHYTI